MKRKKQKSSPIISVVIADWKDTESLLQGIRDALKRRGIALQAWDLGTDDWIVSISDKKITPAQLRAETIHPEMEPEPTEVDL